MRRPDRRLALAPAALTAALALAVAGAGDEPAPESRAAAPAPAATTPTPKPEPAAPPVPAPAPPAFDLDTAQREAGRVARVALDWYRAIHPADRVTWGGLAAAAALGLSVVFERMIVLRRRRIIPSEFGPRFVERMQDGRLDRGKALDYCELNRHPASRVALAAVKRWGRPSGDLERAVALALRVETARLRRNVGTLRRVAALAPLLGLLGSLFALGRTLSGLSAEAGPSVWGPALAQALWPLTAGVGLATIALVLYDGLAGKVEKLAGMLETIGAETIDAIATSVPVEPRPAPPAPAPTVVPHTHAHAHAHGHGHTHHNPGPARTPHQIRLEIPKPGARVRIDDEDDFD